jgi:cobalamin biosynthesis protein CobC
MIPGCSPLSAPHPEGHPMPAESGREHGGGLDRAATQYGIPRERWIDLSTGINPACYPLPVLPPALWHLLPDAALYDRLRAAAASCYGAHDASLVVPAPGSQALIQWLPRVEASCRVPVSRVAVLGPTYNEHAPAWAAAGHAVVEVDGVEAIPCDADVVVVVNPNNPDGRVVEPRHLLELSERRLVVVDEAFADVVPEVSVARWVGRPNLVVLRSIGKFFGLAGLRLGFALAERKRALALEAALGPWSVSGPAAAIGAAALADKAWIAATRARLAGAAARLDALVAASGIGIGGGTLLFRLLVHPDADGLFERLARSGILARRFAARPRWLRLGLPADETQWARLAGALADWQEGRLRKAGQDGRPSEQPPRT